MTRPLRMVHEGGWYRVINRGIERRAIFRDDRDRERFLERLGEARERLGLETHPFVLMWSSYRSYAGYAQPPEWLVEDEVVARTNAQGGESRRRYREATEAYVRQGMDESLAAQLRQRLAVGTAEFVRRLARGVAGVSRETSGRRQLRHRVTFDQIVAAVERVKGESWARFRDRHGDTGRDLVLWAARRWTGLTLRELGSRVGGADYATVSGAVLRLEKRAAHDRHLAAALKQVEDVIANAKT